jgi:putative transposase
LPAGPGRRAAGRPGPAHLQLRLGQLAYEQALLDAGCRISHDGRGRATDNAFIERLWRTVKWEHIYPNPADDGHHLYHQLQAYFAYYNYRRPHQNLGGQTPAQVFAQPSLPKYKHIT